jgi:hypothetical protein
VGYVGTHTPPCETRHIYWYTQSVFLHREMPPHTRTPPCGIRYIYRVSIIQGGVWQQRDICTYIYTLCINIPLRLCGWQRELCGNADTSAGQDPGATRVKGRRVKVFLSAEKCQFITEKCQFITEKCQFITEKWQFETCFCSTNK